MSDTKLQQLVINVGTKAQIDAGISGGTITQNMLSIATDGSTYIEGVKVNGTELTPDANNKVDVTVPTSASDVGALSSSTKYGADLSYSSNTLQLKDQDGNSLGNPVTISSGSSLPSQTGHSGEFLTTDGTDASWSAINALQNKSTGTDSLVIAGNASSISYGVSIGYGTYVSSYGTVVGYSASSGSSNTVNVGASSYTGSFNSVAIGSNAMVMYNSSGSMALGYYAKIGNNASGAIQLGYGTNSTANTFAVGLSNNNYTLLNGTTGLIPPERHASVSNTAGDYYAKITVDSQGNVTQSWENISHIVETYSSGTSWYRIWSDGFVEQGGEESSSSNQNKTVTFLVPFADTNYTYIATPITSAGSAEVGAFSKTTTTIITNVYGYGTQGFSWVAFGKKS